MGNQQKVRITQGQGNLLLLAATTFVLPDKLGDTPYTIVDRSIAEQEVGRLYQELKSRSPLLQKKGKNRSYVFGPIDNMYEEAENGRKWWEINDTDREVEISVDDDVRNGIFWCLLLNLHPGSPRRIPASTQVEVAWPLAKRLEIEEEIRQEIGMEKARPRRLILDSERQKKREEEKAKEKKEKQEVG